MKEVNYFQKFYKIESVYFRCKNDQFVIDNNKGETYLKYDYKKIKPVFVYAKNINWDGEKTFDICPVDFSKSNKNESWRWRLTCKYSDIGKIIFNTEEESIKFFENSYSKEEIEKWKKLEKLHVKKGC